MTMQIPAWCIMAIKILPWALFVAVLLWNRLLAHSKKADRRTTDFWREQHDIFSSEYLKKDKELTKTRAELTDMTDKRDAAMSSWNNLAVMHNKMIDDYVVETTKIQSKLRQANEKNEKLEAENETHIQMLKAQMSESNATALEHMAGLWALYEDDLKTDIFRLLNIADITPAGIVLHIPSDRQVADDSMGFHNGELVEFTYTPATPSQPEEPSPLAMHDDDDRQPADVPEETPVDESA